MDIRIKFAVRTVSVIREEIDPELPMQQLALFFAVAEAGDEGITMGEVMDKLKMGQTSVSKNAKQLSRYTKRDETGNLVVRGYDLIEVRPDLLERRRFRMTLTPRGRQVCVKIISLCNEFFPQGIGPVKWPTHSIPA